MRASASSFCREQCSESSTDEHYTFLQASTWYFLPMLTFGFQLLHVLLVSLSLLLLRIGSSIFGNNLDYCQKESLKTDGLDLRKLDCRKYDKHTNRVEFDRCVISKNNDVLSFASERNHFSNETSHIPAKFLHSIPSTGSGYNRSGSEGLTIMVDAQPESRKAGDTFYD